MEIQIAVSHPRNKQSLSEIDATINWEPIEKIVMENYSAGQSDFLNMNGIDDGIMRKN